MTAEAVTSPDDDASHNPAWPFALDDPYPTYRAMRADQPVRWDDGLSAWLVLSHEHATAVLHGPEWSADPRHHPELFERLGGNGPGGALLAKMLVFTDPPDHDRLRRAVNRFFTPHQVSALRPRIARLATAVFDADSGPADESLELMADVAYPLPLAVICELLDVGADVAGLLRVETPAMTAMLDALAPPSAARAAAAAATTLMMALVPIVADRRGRPGDDLLTKLLEVLDPDEAIVMALLLLAAGHETTSNLIGNGTLALAQHPDQLDVLRRQPELLGAAVEELLRWDSPVQVTGRVATTATTLGGRRIAAGERAVVVLGAANRDPAAFADPDRLDLARTGPPHLAFGHGAHFCVGAALARAEAAEVFAHLAARPWRLDSWERAPSATFRRLARLDLVT